MNLFWLNVDEIEGVIHQAGFVSNQEDTKGVLKHIRDATEKRYGVNPNPRSIPHPWARAILTERYVLMNEKEVGDIATEEGKKLHKSMVGRWRGCLSLIALSEIYGLNLEYKEIGKLNKIGESIDFMKPTPERTLVISPFVLEHPEKVIDYIIYCNHEPIAMTSTTVGIIPGFILGNNQSKNYPWAINSEFVDPIERLSRGERIILYAWLHSFIESLEVQKHAAQDRSSKLVASLKIFQKDLDLSAEDMAIGRTVGDNTRPIKGIDARENIYIGLDRRVMLNTSNYSEAIIKDSNICVVDENQRKVDYGKETLLLGMLDSRMFLKNRDLFEKFLPGEQKIYILSSNDIFLDNCFGFRTELFNEKDIKGIDVKFSTMGIDSNIHKVVEGFSLLEEGNSPQDSYVCILPVKASAAKILGDNVISESVKVTGVDGRIAVKIGFTLQQGGQIPIEKHYNLGDTLHELPSENIPTTTIWPNIPNCKYYYMASKWGIDYENGFIFSPVGEKIEQLSGANKYQNLYTYSIEEYPKMLRCYRHNPINNALEEIGIIKTRSLKELEVQTKIGEYSLDFGTSSTVAAYRLKTDTPESASEISFENQVSVITTSAKAAKEINKLMLGSYTVASPFPTIYFDKSRNKAGILKGGHPYYGIPGKRIVWDSNQLVSNIKFTPRGDATIVDIQKDYIKSIVCMMMVHAAKNGIVNIELKLSYPISIKNIDSFKSGIQAEMKTLQGQNLFPVTLKNTGEFVTESEAAARFFSNKNMGLRNSLTIDIGGGSVDIFAFTQLVGGYSAMISSITKGSRKILLDTLKKTTDLVADAVFEVRKKYPASSSSDEIIEERYTKPQTYNEMTSREYYTAMEILLLHNFNVDGAKRNIGEEISLIFKRAAATLGVGENLRKVRGLQTIWLFWLSSFFYYGALMYNKSWDLVAGEHDSLHSLQIFLSGRGSNLIDWLPDNASKFLVEIAKNALNKSSAVIKMERNDKEERKLESAKGMLLPALKAGTNSEVLDQDSFILDYVAGEKFFDKAENELSEYTLIKSQISNSAKALAAKEALLRIDSDYPIFRNFLEVYSNCVEQFGLQDTVYKLYLGDISQVHGIDQSEYISLPIGEFNSLVNTYVVDAVAGATDEPIFSALADAAGKLLSEKLL